MNKLRDFLSERKIRISDLVLFLSALEITRLDLIGDEGIKAGIIDFIREEGVEVNVISRRCKEVKNDRNI